MNAETQAIVNAIVNSLDLGKISGRGGTKFINSAGGAYTGQNFTSLAIRESSVLTTLVAVDSAGNETNYLTAAALGSVTLNTPDLIIAPSGMRFSKVTLSSGSALGYM